MAEADGVAFCYLTAEEADGNDKEIVMVFCGTLKASCHCNFFPPCWVGMT